MQQLHTEKSPGFSSIFNLSPEGYNELLLVGVTLDQLYILENYRKEIDLSTTLNTSRFQANRQTLIRKGYLQMDNSITVAGAALLKGVVGKMPLEEVIEEGVKVAGLQFDDWWLTFPSTDIFEHKGKHFTGSRAMRIKKDECRKKFESILAEGKCTAEDLIQALKYEIHLKKEASIQERSNKLKYMHNSLSYLNQRDFEPFIEVAKGHKEEEQSPINNNSDI